MKNKKGKKGRPKKISSADAVRLAQLAMLEIDNSAARVNLAVNQCRDASIDVWRRVGHVIKLLGRVSLLAMTLPVLGQSIRTHYVDSRRPVRLTWDAVTNAVSYNVAFVIGTNSPTIATNVMAIEHATTNVSTLLNSVGLRTKLCSAWVQSVSSNGTPSDWAGPIVYLRLR